MFMMNPYGGAICYALDEQGNTLAQSLVMFLDGETVQELARRVLDSLQVRLSESGKRAVRITLDFC